MLHLQESQKVGRGRRTQNKLNKWKRTSKTVAFNPTLSIITLNAMEQNMLIKRVCQRGQKLNTQLYAWFELRNESTIIDVNTFLSLMDRSNRKSVRMEKTWITLSSNFTHIYILQFTPKYISLNCIWNIHQNRLYSEL